MRATIGQYCVNRRENNFNLIRFVAAVLVLYSHSIALALGDRAAEHLVWTGGMTWGGIAVDLFFLSSGFLIAGSLLQRRNLIAFVWARALRIFPALIVAALLTVLVLGLAFTTRSVPEFLTEKQTWRYLLMNATLVKGVTYTLPGVFTDLPYPRAVNGSLWTLPYELRLYAYLAAVGTALMVAQSRSHRRALVPRGLLLTAVLLTVAHVANHFRPFAPEKSLALASMFFVGAAFYVYRDRIVLSTRAAAALALVLAAALIHPDAFFVAYCLAVPYLLFYAAYVPAGVIRRFNRFGDYSYGIYIYAFPVQQTLAALIVGVSVASMFFLASAITFVLAYASWHLVEKHALKHKGQHVVFERLIDQLRLAPGILREGWRRREDSGPRAREHLV